MWLKGFDLQWAIIAHRQFWIVASAKLRSIFLVDSSYSYVSIQIQTKEIEMPAVAEVKLPVVDTKAAEAAEKRRNDELRAALMNAYRL